MILTICNYFKKCFCKHDFELIDTVMCHVDYSTKMPSKIIKVYRCKKCGYVQKIKY